MYLYNIETRHTIVSGGNNNNDSFTPDGSSSNTVVGGFSMKYLHGTKQLEHLSIPLGLVNCSNRLSSCKHVLQNEAYHIIEDNMFDKLFSLCSSSTNSVGRLAPIRSNKTKKYRNKTKIVTKKFH